MNQKKKKMILTIALLVSFVPMFMIQYKENSTWNGTGLIHLFHPLTFFAIILYFIGSYELLKDEKNNNRFAIIGLCLIILVEIYHFLTWNQPNINIYLAYLEGTLQNPFDNVYVSFYVGLISSITMLIFYIIFTKKYNTKLVSHKK